jgi:ABC-type nitrate/sulfonate/bicarbonate transport system substrate-binding protein
VRSTNRLKFTVVIAAVAASLAACSSSGGGTKLTAASATDSAASASTATTSTGATASAAATASSASASVAASLAASAAGSAGASAPASAPASAGSTDLVTLNVGGSFANTGGIFDIAQYEGFFAKNGLKINAIAYAGGPPAVEALLAGRAKIASFAPSTSIETWQTANPLVTVAFTQNAAPQYAIVSKKFLQSKGVDPATFASLPFAKRVAYLKGTVWGTHAIGGLIDHYTDILVAIGGLSPKDVTLDALGTPAADEASFKGGRVNAIWVDQVTEADFVKNDDAVNIFDPTDPAIAKLLAPVELSSGGSGWILSKKWADANTATLDKFLTSLLQAGQWVKSHTAADQAQVVAQHNPATPYATILGYIQENAAYTPTDLTIPEASIEANIDLAIDSGAIKATPRPPDNLLFDPSYLAALKSS